MMILEQNFPKKSGSHKKIKVICDECGILIARAYRDYLNLCKHKELCRPCAHLKAVQSDTYRKKMSDVQKLKHKKDPSIRKRMSETMIKNKVNKGEKNAMKRLDVVARMKVSRKKYLENPDVRKAIAEASAKAWADGKFESVRVGQCEWFDYIKSDGTAIKCQGKWELAFAKWLDNNNIDFIAHRGRIKYTDQKGIARSYYPDFYLIDKKCYIDVKNDYHLSLQKEKFKQIFSQNKHLNFLIFRKRDLHSLNIMVK